jgi:hypothetical protein
MCYADLQNANFKQDDLKFPAQKPFGETCVAKISFSANNFITF